MNTTITITYTDQPNEVVDKINDALKTRGFRFVVDRDADRDAGEVVYKLEFVTK